MSDAEDATQPAKVLEVKDLRVHYRTPRGEVIAVNGLDFDVFGGETLGLVGESGCGKSTTAMAILRLVQPPGYIAGGSITLDGTDMLSLSERQLRELRWRQISLIPQGSMNSLNPVMRIKDQIADGIEAHQGRQPRKELKERILELLGTVNLPARVYDMYPHELSGGMKQRVCIAMAIAHNLSLIIADEPTSALDVVVQRQVMGTLLKVQEELGAALLLIGHDMDLMAQVVDRVGIMYAGNFAEVSNVGELFEKPLHPYSQMLISSLPSLEHKGVFQGIPGLPPSLLHRPEGCAFRSRCPRAFDRCVVEDPPLREVQPGRQVACHLY